MPSRQLELMMIMLRVNRGTRLPPLSTRRALFEQFAAAIAEDVGVRVDADVLGGVPIERYTPPDLASDRVLFYLHGGGYQMGSLATHRDLVARIALAARMPAVSVGYRLAPEHPFPAALDDALAAYRALSQGRARIVVAGDSAGAGLATALLSHLSSSGLQAAVRAVLLSPWVDLAGTGASLTTHAARDPLLRPDDIHEAAGTYLAGGDARDPRASPLYGDLSALPPTLVQVGSEEILYDDAIRLVEAARAAGVDVTLDEEARGFHVWHLYPQIPESGEAIMRIAAFLAR